MENSFDLTRPIAIGCDHAGFEMKEVVISYLESKDLAFRDFGTGSKDAVDYPDFAHPLAEAVESGDYACGILFCGSGNGVGITANKHGGVRAAVCWGDEIAGLARKHNNANVICIPARFVSETVAQEMVGVFLTTEFEGGRHSNRVNKISC